MSAKSTKSLFDLLTFPDWLNSALDGPQWSLPLGIHLLSSPFPSSVDRTRILYLTNKIRQKWQRATQWLGHKRLCGVTLSWITHSGKPAVMLCTDPRRSPHCGERRPPAHRQRKTEACQQPQEWASQQIFQPSGVFGWLQTRVATWLQFHERRWARTTQLNCYMFLTLGKCVP